MADGKIDLVYKGDLSAEEGAALEEALSGRNGKVKVNKESFHVTLDGDAEDEESLINARGHAEAAFPGGKDISFKEAK